MIYIIAVIVLLLISYVMIRDHKSSSPNLNIGKIQDDIIEITIDENLMKLFHELSSRNRRDELSELRYRYERGIIRNSSGVLHSLLHNTGLLYDRLLVSFVKNERDHDLVFSYVVENFNAIEIGRIPYKHIECDLNAKIHMRCDDSIGIVNLLETEVPTIKSIVVPSKKHFTSFGYSFTGLHEATVVKGLLDDSWYYEKDNKYVKIDHRCIK